MFYKIYCTFRRDKLKWNSYSLGMLKWDWGMCNLKMKTLYFKSEHFVSSPCHCHVSFALFSLVCVTLLTHRPARWECDITAVLQLASDNPGTLHCSTGLVPNEGDGNWEEHSIAPSQPTRGLVGALVGSLKISVQQLSRPSGLQTVTLIITQTRPK